MRVTETRQLFTESCEYPTDQTTITDAFGDVEIEAPTGETTTVDTVLARSAMTTYQSADDVFATVMSNLDESFIGRKYYDDRGDNQPHPHSNWQ